MLTTILDFVGGWKIKLAIALVLSSVLLAGWYYVKSLQAEVKAAAVREAQYKSLIAAKEEETKAIKRDLNSVILSQRKLSNDLKVARSNVVALEKRFEQKKSGEPRDLRADALANPTGVENAINRGTKDALRCGELMTGSPLSEQEKSGKVKNTICPDLVKVEKK